MNKTMLAAAIAAASGMGYSVDAMAQTADSTPPPADSAQAGDEISEVVVTARRHSENAEQVPASIKAFDSEQLAEQGIETQADLQASVPGLTVRETQGSNSLTFSIRGQTIDAFTGSKTAVVPYFNEVQLVTGGASTFFDLESIQVLKGPQGTLFGRNATGGAVLYTSAKPKDEVDGYIKFRDGNYNLHEGVGAFNVPLLDHKLLLRFAGDVTYQDGYQLNTFDNQYLGKVARQSGRISLLARPMDGLENSLTFELDHVGGNSTATKLHTVNRCGATNGGAALNCNADFLFSPAVDVVYGPGTWDAYVAAHPNVNPNGIAAYLDQDASKLGFWQANEVSPVFHNEQDYSLVNTTSYDVAPDMQVKNIFGVSQSNTRDLGSSVGAPYLVFTSENFDTDEKGNHVDQYTYSDELQLQGKALQQALTYIVGAYYQSQDSKSLFPQVYFDLSPDGPPSSTDSDFEIKDRTPAVYTQGTYDFRALGLRRLSFTAGYRYTWESVNITQLSESPYNPGSSQSTSVSNPSWTAGLSYQATDQLLLYVEGRRSWRSGGFNGTAPPFVDGVTTNLFRPEFTRDVELGTKYAGSVLGRPVRFNLALYNQWIDNVQRAEFPQPPGGQSIAYTVNVPKAQVAGVELDASLKPVRWLETGLTGALTRASFIDGHNTVSVFGTEYVFDSYADAPNKSGSLYATVFMPAQPSLGLMDIRADLYGQSGTYFSNNNGTITPDTRIPGYGLINMRYDWKEIFGSKFSFAAYVRNLTDKQYYTGGFALTASLGVNSVSVGTPQMFGGELSYNF